MVSVSWDNKGTLLTEYFPDREQRVNSQTYFDTFMKLRKAIKGKTHGMLSHKVWLFHDNATPHTARLAQNLLSDFGWNVFTHPLYSPNLAPLDFHLFPMLKKWLRNQRFKKDTELITAVEQFFAKLDIAFYTEGIKKLVPHDNKCLTALEIT